MDGQRSRGGDPRARGVVAARHSSTSSTRIERLDPPINAVVQWDLDRARAAAHVADEAVAHGDKVGALHGVPMTIKDSFQTEGCITTSGSPDFAQLRARRRRLAGGQAASGRCDPVRQDQPADLRRRHPELQRRVRHHQQPARPRPQRAAGRRAVRRRRSRWASRRSSSAPTSAARSASPPTTAG